MKNSQIFNKMAKSKGARIVAAYAVFLLVMQPYALAMDQVVNKYASDYVVQAQDIGNSHLLDIGTVFNFNNAKAASTICLKPGEPGYPQAGCTDNLSLSEIDESNCNPDSTEYTFDMGDDGWEGVASGANPTSMKFLYDATNYGIEANITGKNKTATFTYTKKFFYECGIPGMSDFKIRYQVRAATGINTTAGNNYFKVELVKPLGGVLELVPQTNFTGLVAWTWKPGPADTNTTTIATSNWSESGVYTLRITGQLKTTTTGTGHIVAVQFDDIDLRKTSLWTDYRHDVEYFVKAAPYSQLGGAGGGYNLQIKAAKKEAGADTVNVLVYNGASWTNRGTITQTYDDTLPQNNLQVLSIPLSDAEYNNGLVRVRYVDASQTGDSTPGGVYIDYQRINVDQGTCVQEVKPIEADCGKCHNYGGDVTKPWPLQGMHNKHAQTESVSDCAWCHPDVTVGGTVYPSDHMNGVQDGRAIEVAGTKIYRSGGANPQGALGVWDPATGRCTTSDCHNNLTTPSWTATYGATNGELNGTTVIARNCSRCHNKGAGNSTPGADDVANLNINVAWPDTLAHKEHDTAFVMDESSCQSNGSCHPDNRGQHSPVKDADGIVTKMSPKYQSPSGSGVKYIKESTTLGDGRCYSATCHGGQETPKWNAAVGSLDPAQGNAYCKACHKAEKATTWTPGAVLPAISAKQYNSPISGLHQGAPPTSGKSHVSEYGCAVCHVANPAKHFKDGDNTTNLDTWTMDPVGAPELVGTMGYAAGTGTSPSYGDGTPPTCATPNPGPNAYVCHAETDTASAIGKLSGTNTPWNRDWSWDAYSSNAGDRCKVCHGVYGNFKSGMRPAHTSNKLQGNHSDSGNDCATICHAQTDTTTGDGTNLYNHGVSMTADAKTIDVNMNVGFGQFPTAIETALTTAGTYGQQYVIQTGTTDYVGCNGCHNNGQVDTRFRMQESGWKLRNQLTGPGVTCTNCHGDSVSKRYWPDTTGVDDGATTADRIGAHELHMAWLANKVYSQTVAQLLVDAATDTKQRALCQYCHQITDGDHGSATVAEVFPSATYAKRIQDGAADTGTLAAFETTGNTCSNVDCHAQYGTAAAGSDGLAATPDWYITPTHTFATTSMNCAACHNNPSSDTTGKHTVHAGTTFGISMTCASCHGASVAWGTPGTPPATFTSHLNGTFALSSALSPAPSYTGTFRTSFGSCGTNYCHRSDASAGTAPVATATWGTAQAGSCNFCHLEAMTSNKHAQHLASNSLPGTAVNECYVCHNSTATSGGVASGANHINGADDLNFNTTFANYEASAAARAAGTGATTTCSNTKCHNGVTTPTWSSTVSCGSCHNTTSNGPLPSATSVAGEHAKHANNDATYTDCAQCHPNAASYTAVGGHADHQNLAANVTVASSTYTDTTEGGVNYQSADATHTDDGSCAFTGGCHGSGANVGWATASTLTNGCFDCHGGGLSATETSTAKPLVDTIPNPMNNTQYTTQGHGRSGTFPGSGATAPAYTYATNGCYQCHDSTSTHAPAASATDPFRLGATYAANTNNLCLKAGCHDTPAIATHTEAIVNMGADWPPATGDYDFKCVDCHDPHGDGNYYMVRSHISAPTTAGDTSFGSDSYGTPQDSAAISAVTFTSLTGMAANSFGVSGTGNGICEVCHNQTSYYIRGSATVDTHNTSGNCTTSCHKHDAGFKGAGGSCTGCHTANATTSVGAITSGSAGSFGATMKHVSGTMTDDHCKVCHNDATQTMSTGSLVRDKIQLKNPDTGAVIVIDQSLAGTDATRNLNTVTFCTKCHDSDGATSTKFGATATQPFGNGVTVKNVAQYYNDAITGKTHNYSFNATPQLVKARSPHGKPGTNIMKNESARTNYLTDSAPVGCQSCHPSHGGANSNPVPTISGGSDINSTIVNATMVLTGYSEPGNCWTCHNAAGVKDYYGDNTVGGNWTAVQNSSFTYKKRNYLSLHQTQMTAFSQTRANARANTDTVTSIACSTCHNPHGSTTWVGANGTVAYQSFSLRGNWMTSPYLEDRAGTIAAASANYKARTDLGPRAEPLAAYNLPATLGHGYSAAGGTGNDGYFLDENTFGPNATLGYPTGAWTTMSETVTNFGALCANCHAASVATNSGGTTTTMQSYLNSASGGTAGWSATAKIHNTVKGWYSATNSVDQVNFTNNPKMHLLDSTKTQAVRALQSAGSYSPRMGNQWGVNLTAGTKQTYHTFSCSKCHTPHASSLPRLLVTNCLDVGSGTTSRAAKTATYNNAVNPSRAALTYPTYGTGSFSGATNGSDVAMHCHNIKKSNLSGGGWNTLTGW